MLLRPVFGPPRGAANRDARPAVRVAESTLPSESCGRFVPLHFFDRLRRRSREWPFAHAQTSVEGA